MEILIHLWFTHATAMRGLSDLVVSGDSVVVEHCDDLLIESVSADSCATDLLYCCWLIVDTKHLKLQLCLPKVEYLGHMQTGSLSQAILLQ